MDIEGKGRGQTAPQRISPNDMEEDSDRESLPTGALGETPLKGNAGFEDVEPRLDLSTDSEHDEHCGGSDSHPGSVLNGESNKSEFEIRGTSNNH